jgi:hypothetical protein
MRIRGHRLDTERAFHVKGINKCFHGYAQATTIFHGYTKATNIFHGYTLDNKSENAEKMESVIVQKLSVQLWSVNQRTTEAEVVTDS